MTDFIKLLEATGPLLQGIVHMLTIVGMAYGAYRVMRREPAGSARLQPLRPSARRRRMAVPSPFASRAGMGGQLEMFLDSGLTHDTPLPRRVAARCTNFVAAAMMCLTIFWSLLAAVLWPDRTGQIFIHLFFFLAFCCSLLLSQAQRLGAARWLLLGSGMLYYCMIVTAVGPRMGIEVYLVIAACLPPLIFEGTERAKIYLAYGGIALSAGTVAYLQHTGVVQGSLPWGAWQHEIGYYLAVVASVTILCSALQFFMWSAWRNLAELDTELTNTERLLHDLLPDQLIDALESGRPPIAATSHEATVLLAYLAGLPSCSKRLAPARLMELLDRTFGEFDAIIGELHIQKVNTFGNAYLCAVGLFGEPDRDELDAIGMAALRMVRAVEVIGGDVDLDLKVRIGICTGETMAGMIGRSHRSFGLWGETLRIARALDAEHEGSCIRVAESSYLRLRSSYLFGPPERRQVTGVGDVDCYPLIGPLSTSTHTPPERDESVAATQPSTATKAD